MISSPKSGVHLASILADSARMTMIRLSCVGILRVTLQEIAGISWPVLLLRRTRSQNSAELRKVCGEAPCLEGFRTVHQ